MSNDRIFILSQPVQKGKTSMLQNWLKTKKNLAGVLTPDINGFRNLRDIGTGNDYPLQLMENKTGLKIGRFVFDEAVFQKGSDILLKTIAEDHEWTIIDEVGKLELFQNKGFAEATSKLVSHFQSSTSQGKLLLVIRDYLLDEAIVYYGLEGAKVLPASFFKGEITLPLIGVVLCGGESSRMKTDKAFLEYHNKPQYQYATEILDPFCDDCFLSVNAHQHPLIDSGRQKITDLQTYTDAGPLTGLLTVMNSQQGSGLMVMGCDYPFLKRSDLLLLFNERDRIYDAICFKNESGFTEPLIAIYEQRSFGKLKDYYEKGGRSLQQFLNQINTKFIKPKEVRALTSVDTIEGYNDVKNGGS